MKKIKNILTGFIGFSALLLTSCDTGYLETEPTKRVSESSIIKIQKISPAISDAIIKGVYTTTFSTRTGGTKNHEDFGQKSYDIYMDMLCGDMKLAGKTYGQYSGIAELYATTDATALENYRVWRYYYRVIKACNSILGPLADKTEFTSDRIAYNVGQAKAMRAYAYFYLTNLLYPEYEADKLALPIYINLDQPAQDLSKMSDVYDLIKSDLTSAITLLDGMERTSKISVNKYVAEGLLSYVYATLGEYDKTIELTNDVINNGGFELLAMDELTTTGFDNVNEEGWMWGVDLTLDIGLDLVSWWGQMDIFTYSYAFAGDAKTMDEGLYASIPDTDGRKKQFELRGGNYAPIYKFYNEDRKPGGQREVTSDYVYMRVAEMYLLRAEAYAFSGNDSEASNALYSLLKERDANADFVKTLTGQDLKDEIYKQWKIEMWGEGKSYLAMKRNKATITRTGHLSDNGDFKYNDNKLNFLIPINERQNNPNFN